MISLRFEGHMEPEDVAAFLRAVRPLFTTRACRTCDYGESPSCGHEERARRVCVAPTGDFDCAALPCLGGCSTPTTNRPAAEMGA